MQPLTFMIATAFFILVIVYLILLRPWQLRWGATDDEVKRLMPGDEIISNPTFNATRAVTIDAPAEDIYPWVVQMGLTREGQYGYDLPDNLGRQSSASALPDRQPIQAGDMLLKSPDGKQGMLVKDSNKDKWMVWWDTQDDISWAWAVQPEGNIRARLVTRLRVKYKLFSPVILLILLIEFFDILMMRKCMLGIKKRAEGIRA